MAILFFDSASSLVVDVYPVINESFTKITNGYYDILLMQKK